MTNKVNKSFILIGTFVIGIIICTLLSGTFLAMPQLILKKRSNKLIKRKGI